MNTRIGTLAIVDTLGSIGLAITNAKKKDGENPDPENTTVYSPSVWQ